MTCSTNNVDIFSLCETFLYQNVDDKTLYGPGHAKTCLKPYTNNEGADQPAHSRNLISTFVVRCLDSMICILAISKV